MACNNFRWKAANQSDFKEYKGGKRRIKERNILSILRIQECDNLFSLFPPFIKSTPDCGVYFNLGKKAE